MNKVQIDKVVALYDKMSYLWDNIHMLETLGSDLDKSDLDLLHMEVKAIKCKLDRIERKYPGTMKKVRDIILSDSDFVDDWEEILYVKEKDKEC